jgi:hypothetical protein
MGCEQPFDIPELTAFSNHRLLFNIFGRGRVGTKIIGSVSKCSNGIVSISF